MRVVIPGSSLSFSGIVQRRQNCTQENGRRYIVIDLLPFVVEHGIRGIAHDAEPMRIEVHGTALALAETLFPGDNIAGLCTAAIWRTWADDPWGTSLASDYTERAVNIVEQMRKERK